MEPAGRKFQPGTGMNHSSSRNTVVRVSRTTPGSGSSSGGVNGSGAIRDVHRTNKTTTTNYSNNHSSSSHSNSYYEQEDGDLVDQDYVHVPSNYIATSAAAAAEEQRPPTLALEEEDLYMIYNKSNSHNTSHSHPVKKRNVVSKMFFWKRNSNAKATPEERGPTATSTTGSSSGSVHASAGTAIGIGIGIGIGTSYHQQNLGVGDPDAVSVIAVPPTSTISGSSTPSRPFHRRATMDHAINSNNTVPNNTMMARPETNIKPVKIKPTKVSLSSLLQQPQTQPPPNAKSSNISNASVTSLLTAPPTTIIDTSISNSFTPSKTTNAPTHATTLSQKSRNHVHTATPPSKASSMINLSAGGYSGSMIRPSRDPPTATETMSNPKATSVIGMPPTTVVPKTTTSIETLWRERQQSSSQPQKLQSPYHHEPPESPTPSQYSSKNSITTMSVHSSSTTAFQGKNKHATSTTSKTPLLSSYQTNTPITKHYNISQQILHAFELYYTSATAAPATANESNHQDDEDDDNAYYVVTAYTIGVQYIETVLIEIPKHGYYYSKKHQKERLQSSINALHVGHLLLHLIENNDTDNTAFHKDPPALPATPPPTKDKERNHIQNLIGIAMTHIEQVMNAACGNTAADTTKSASSQSNTTNQRRNASASSASTSSMSWLEQQYNHSVSILSLSTVCCGHDLVDPSPTAATTTTTNTNATMLSPTVVSSIIPILQGRQPSQQESKQRSSKTKQLMSNKPDPISSSSSSSVFMTNDLDDAEARRTGSTPSRHIPRQNTISSLNSHQSSIKSPEEALMLEKALFLSGLEVSSSHSNNKNNHHHHPDLLDISTTSSRWGNSEKRLSVSSGTMIADSSNNSNNNMDTTVIVQGSSSLELATLAQLYHEDFDSLQQSGRVRISYADTYQGRHYESTNGCTVIAPLICIHHLINSSGVSRTPLHCSDPGLTDSEIAMVIDEEAPSVLSELRQSLGLAEHAFLIPADVHDYLLDQGQLSSSQFINVTGGNILNDEHLQAFISILEKASNKDGTQKIGATLFFHEHVLAICKLHRSDPTTGAATRSWYDIIDSLPNPATLRRCSESMTDVYHRIGMFNAVNVEECMMNHMIPKTARIRCLDVDALCAVLKWYACSKFTAENISYIDQYPWDEQTCDFDPRVFQAFIWGSCADGI